MTTPPRPHQYHTIHPLSSDLPAPPPLLPSSLLTLLRKHLPFSLPLYRRLQFAHFSPVSRVFLSFDPATTPPSSGPDNDDGHDDDDDDNDDDDNAPWLAAYCDPDRGPETQAFLFGSWEVEGRWRRPRRSREEEREVRDGGEGPVEGDPRVVALVKGFLVALGDSDGTCGSADGRRRSILIGSVHETTARVLHSLGVLDPHFVDREPDGVHVASEERTWRSDLERSDEKGREARKRLRMPERYNKWLFDLRDVTFRQTLPQGFYWGHVMREHFDLVRSGTTLFRSDRLLSMLPSTAIYLEDKGHYLDPIAWVFLGVDMSLTSLYVEEAYRGQGLAKLLAQQSWLDHLDSYENRSVEERALGTERWAHADVAIWNGASNALCRSLGGKTEWADYWYKVDLGYL